MPSDSSSTGRLTGAPAQENVSISAAALAALLGLFLIWGTAFSNITVLHNAAHDARHSYGFACQLVSPHFYGSPQPVSYETAVPGALAHQFIVASVMTNLLSWLSLGVLTGYFCNRLKVVGIRTVS